MAGAIITLCDTDFTCPECGHLHTEDDYYERLRKSNRGLIYQQCKGCKTKLGITYDCKGDTVVWTKDSENKLRREHNV